MGWALSRGMFWRIFWSWGGGLRVDLIFELFNGNGGGWMEGLDGVGEFS